MATVITVSVAVWRDLHGAGQCLPPAGWQMQRSLTVYLFNRVAVL